MSFGNGAFGVQDAAQTYFGINASDLNWQQAALLAGHGAVDQRAQPVHQPRRRAGAAKPGAGHHDRELARRRPTRCAPPRPQPLGVLPQPNELPRGCIAAGDRAFFCDYVQEYLSRAGISKEQVARGGYLIRTTLDPDVQDPGQGGHRQVRQPDARRASRA